MVQFLSGNVLLKPAQKRRVLSHLKRCTKLGERIGDFKLFVQLQRTGRAVQAKARVRDKAGAFEVTSRDNHWETAIDNMIRQLNSGVHAHRLAAA
jgi:ribosome-associated translation inhibitor RaiA